MKKPTWNSKKYHSDTFLQKAFGNDKKEIVVFDQSKFTQQKTSVKMSQ